MARPTTEGRPTRAACLIGALAGLLALAPAGADTPSAQADGVRFLAARPGPLGAVVRFVGQPNKVYQCAILDATGAELARATAMSHLGQMTVRGVAAEAIAGLRCRTVM